MSQRETETNRLQQFHALLKQHHPLIAWYFDEAVCELRGDVLHATVVMSPNAVRRRVALAEEVASENWGRPITVVVRGVDEVEKDAPPQLPRPISRGAAERTSEKAALPNNPRFDNDQIWRALRSDPTRAFDMVLARPLITKAGRKEPLTLCPWHDDRNHPNLSINLEKLVVHCHACKHGGSIADLAKHLWGLDYAGVMRRFEERFGFSGNGSKPRPRLVRTIRYEVRNLEGEVRATHIRHEYDDNTKNLPWDPPGIKTSELPLFQIEKSVDSADGDTVVVCEGEKAAAWLWERRVLAVGTVTGAGGTPCDAALKPLTRFRVLLWPDNDSGGREHMLRIGNRLFALGHDPKMLKLVVWDGAPDRGDAADFDGDIDALLDRAQVWAGPQNKEAPRPLFREIVPGAPFPTGALGKYGAAAAADLQRATQAHPSICGQSILATMNLVTMGHGDVQSPHGEIRPSAEYFLTIAESGARKTSADNRATAGVVEYQNEHDQEFRKQFFEYKNDLEAYNRERADILAWKPRDAKGKVQPVTNLRELRKEKLDALGEEPEPPITHIVLVGGDPTHEGSYRRFREQGASIAGQFTSEGAGLVGGHSMSDEARLRTCAGFSELWDGKPMHRVRGSESASQVRGRRLAMHILIQPRIASKLYADPDVNDQGFFTRLMAVMPDSATTPLRYVPVGEYANLREFTDRTNELLSAPFEYLDAKHPREGLNPPVITLDAEAEALWIEFYNEVADAKVPGGRWHPIRGFAEKAAEHAARHAFTRAKFDDSGIKQIGAEAIRGAITLMKFYLAEQLRIREGLGIDEELKKARDLLGWLQKVWKDDLISLRHIYQLGPYAIRDKATAEKVVKILEDHGWLEKRDPCVVKGVFRRDVWQIVRSSEQ
jgi:hypothetical protein